MLNKAISDKGLPITFIVFYSVGLALYCIPYTREVFVQITPYTLILVAAAVFLHHKEWNVKTIVALLSVIIISILIEIIGVNSGRLFGQYTYLSALGFKIAGTPIIIGLNWAVLIYGSNAIFSGITHNTYAKIAGASTLMVFYDLILEQAAPLMKMWIFKDSVPPMRNYFMWFLLAIIFHSVFEVCKLNTDNRPARALFVIQCFFFASIIVFNFIFIQ